LVGVRVVGVWGGGGVTVEWQPSDVTQRAKALGVDGINDSV